MSPAPCPFCNPTKKDIVLQNDLCYARFDKYPASQGHMLVIPFRHVADVFDLTEEEWSSGRALLHECKALIESNFSPDGYNIGFNVGEAAGQTVLHCHLHLIPRYRGDVADPRGGIRGVVPGKQGY